MLIRVNPAAPEPLFTQLVHSVRGALIAGDVAVGEKLPAARELAASLGINMHTVLKAYNQLRDEGLIELRRGRGAVVTAVPSRSDDLDAAIERVLDLAQQAELPLEHLHATIDHAHAARAATQTSDH